MATYKSKLNPHTGQLQLVLNDTIFPLKGVVATTADLPLTDNVENDCYVVGADDLIYTWNNSSPSGLITDWVAIGNVSTIDWSNVTNKPSSSVASIDSAVSASHTRQHAIDSSSDHTSTIVENNLIDADANGLPDDSGLSVANTSDAISKKHSQNTDTGTTQTTFQIDSGNSGPKIKNSSGTAEIRNSADDDYAPLGLKVIKIPDATATAFIIQEGSNTYLTFDTTDGAERILINKNLEIGSIELEDDAGAYTLINLPITATPVAGTEESYAFKIDGSTVLKIYGEADGSGAVQNIRLVLENGASIANKQNTDIDTGTETVDTFADTIGDGVVWDFVVKNGTNLRCGQMYACWDSSDNVEYTEVSTQDLGDTSGLTLAVDIDTNMVRLRATAGSDNWSVKVIRRVI